MNISRKETTRIIILVLLLAVAAGFSALHVLSKDPIQRYADKVITICKDELYPPSCYDQEIPKLMDIYGIGLVEAFEVATIVQDRDDSYPYCHVLGHNLSAKEASKDLLNWTDVIAKCPSGKCSNGCLHGAFQERFRDENLSEEELAEIIPQLSEVCSDSIGRTFTGLERGSCYHALGHLAIYLTDADPKKSVELCDTVMVGDASDRRHLCYDGVFMQVFQPLEPEDFALIDDIAPQTKKDTYTFCDQFDGLERNSCRLEAWPLFIDEIKTPKGLSNFCDTFGEQSYIDGCYYGMFYLIPIQFNFDKNRIVSFCDSINEPYKEHCFSNTATRLLETDEKYILEAASYCLLAEDRGIGERCWKEMLFYSRFAFHKDSESFVQLCEQLPGDWKDKCFDPNLENVILYE